MGWYHSVKQPLPEEGRQELQLEASITENTELGVRPLGSVSYTHLTLPTKA